MHQAYLVFAAFYHIYDPPDSNWRAIRYAIVQDTIQIYFAPQIVFSAKDSLDSYEQHLAKASDSEREAYKPNAGERPPKGLLDYYGPVTHPVLVDSISDFRPAMEGYGFIPLHLTPKYRKIVDYFTDSLFYEWPEGVVYNLMSMEHDRKARAQFLQSRLNYDDSKLRITFDARMKYATVRYASPFGGGEQIFENVNGKWTFKFQGMSWIY
jgi:hypothetical protein